MLLLADDIVMLSNSWHSTQKKLRILENYCAKNSLVLNPEKSKVLVCHKSPRMKKLKSLFWQNKPLEFTKCYNYLGVPFSASAKFSKAAEHFVQRSNVAGAKVREILIRGKSDTWETKMSLFDSMVFSTLLYAAEIWGLRYCEMIEMAQVKFLKQLFLAQINS